jgi:hypothetical protein
MFKGSKLTFKGSKLTLKGSKLLMLREDRTYPHWEEVAEVCQ